MKQSFSLVACLVLLAAPAWADMKVHIDLNGPNRASGFTGGAYLATDRSTAGYRFANPVVFDTFGLAMSSRVNSGEYFVQIETPSSDARNATSDAISFGTAFLYYTYRTNPALLNDHLTGSARFDVPGSENYKAATMQLQYAMWNLEQGDSQPFGSVPVQFGEPTIDLGTRTKSPISSGLVKFANEAGWTSVGPVRIMKLWSNLSNGVYSGSSSSLLAMEVVPAPAAAILGVLGLGLVVGIFRRRGTAA